MRREFAVVQAYGGVFVLHVQGTRLTVHRTTTTGCTVQGVHDLSSLEYIAGAGVQFVVGPCVDEGLICVHELVGRTTTLLDVRYGVIATTRIEAEGDPSGSMGSVDDESGPEEPKGGLYTSLADPSTSHPSTTSPSTLARHPFLLSTLTGRLYHLSLEPALFFRILVPLDPSTTAPLNPLDAVKLILTKPTLPRPHMILACLRLQILRRASPDWTRKLMQAILAATTSSRSEITAAPPTEETAADVLDALNEPLFDPSPSFPDLLDDRRSTGSKSEDASRITTPVKRRTSSLIGVFSGAGKGEREARMVAAGFFEGALRLNGELDVEDAEIVRALGETVTGIDVGCPSDWSFLSSQS